MFIVRYSSKNLQNYALTLYNDKEVFNFEIVRLNETTFYIDDGPYFDSLEHLIDHYCRIPDGLPTTLTCSINQFKEIVQSRVQPFRTFNINKKMKGKFSRLSCEFLSSRLFLDISIPLKHSFTHQKSNDETKILNKDTQALSSNHRLKFSSSLNSSVTSLNSSSSRSRASSTQESPLSTSSSSASLSSNSPSKQIIDENSLQNRKPIVDRRKTVGGKIKPYTPDSHNEIKIKHLTMPIMTIEKRHSLKLNLISPEQIQQTAKLGMKIFEYLIQGEKHGILESCRIRQNLTESNGIQ